MRLALAQLAILGFGTACCLPAAAAPDGKSVYERTCITCHATGVANAPRFGDRAAWAPRTAAGSGALATSVIKGKGAMPARAGVKTLSDAEIRAAVDYMLGAVR